MVSFSKKLHRNDGHFLRLSQQANEKPKNENFFPEWRALLSVVYVSKRFFYRYLLPAWKIGFLVSYPILVCTRAAGPLPHIPMVCCGLPIRAGWHTGPLSSFSAFQRWTVNLVSCSACWWQQIISLIEPQTCLSLFLTSLPRPCCFFHVQELTYLSAQARYILKQSMMTSSRIGYLTTTVDPDFIIRCSCSRTWHTCNIYIYIDISRKDDKIQQRHKT